MKRREFLKLLGVGGVGTLATAAVLPAMARSHADVAPKLVYDGRYSIAGDYAKRMRDKGVASVDTAGDVVSLWYQDSGAFRLRPGQMMLGYTTWSDYQALRMLIDDTRLGRDNRIQRRGNPTRLVLLQQHSNRHWPESLPVHFTPPSDREKRVQLVTWLAYR